MTSASLGSKIAPVAGSVSSESVAVRSTASWASFTMPFTSKSSAESEAVGSSTGVAFLPRGLAAVALAFAFETVAMISSLLRTDFKPLSSR